MEQNLDNQFRLPTQESQQNFVGMDSIEVEEGAAQHQQEEEELPNTDSKALKSDIFTKHYTKKKLQDGNTYAFCNYCSSKYKFQSGSGYGTYKRHLISKHKQELGIDKSQTQLSMHASSSSQLFRYSDEKNRDELAKFVSVEHLSFSFGEKLGFVNYCQNALNPQAKRIPRTTLTRTVHKLYKKGKKELQDFFLNYDGKVSICSDIWSDHWQQHSYMGITCHWIDSNWNIQKRVIAFRVFDDRHTADNIYRIIHCILEEYNLVRKIFSIGFDNASANTASISDLKQLCQPAFGGKFFHIRCSCHVLNLCVQDGLRLLDFYLTPIKNAISYLWSHPQKMKEWGKFCKLNGKRPKKFPRDVPTRWNSTYELLNESYDYRELLCNFIANNVSTVSLYYHQWSICKKILDVLKVFNDATYTFSGVYYPTSHLFLMECIDIASTLQENEDDEHLNAPINAMKQKWLAYFQKIPLLYLVACIFYPRCKIDGLQEYLTVYYECLSLSEEVNIISIMREVRNILQELYEEYYNSEQNISSSSQSSSQVGDNIRMSRAQQLLMQRQKRPRTSSLNSELDIYLSTAFEFGENSIGKQFPILEWWQQHSTMFPTISLIAKQILACPVSTVAVEQCFSAGGSILDETRSSMSPDSVEAQACLDDWTKAEYRQQENVKEGSDDFYETTEGTTSGGE